MSAPLFLFVNFGTPRSPQLADVLRYRKEIFSDPTVPIPRFLRRILPYWRLRRTAAAYRSLWTTEGPPLLVHSQALLAKVARRVNAASAMQYGCPSIHSVLQALHPRPQDIVLFPLFPQRTTFTTESILRNVRSSVAGWASPPRIRLIPEFHAQAWYVRPYALQLAQYLARNGPYDHLLFSFHGLCGSESESYRTACEESATDIAREVGFQPFSIAFQSKIGFFTWTRPYTIEIIKLLLKNNKKRILAACPGFVADGIETLGEVGEGYRAEFLRRGGQVFDLAPCLNDFSPWADAIAAYCEEFV